MKARTGLAFLAGLALIAGGCASSGTSGAGAAGAGGDIVVGGRTLAEGISPRDNANTRSAQLYLSQAQASDDPAVRQERFQQALEAAQQGMEADPENPLSWFQAGEAHIGLGDYTEADRNLARAEELHPRYFLEIAPVREQAWVDAFNASIGHSNNRDYPAAIRELERANLIFKGRPEAMLNLGNLYSVTDDYDNAIRAYGEAIELIRGPLAEEQTPETLEEWRENESIAVYNRSQLLVQAGRNEEAVVAFREILADDPGNVTVASNLGAALSALGREEEAQQIFNDLMARTDLTARDFLFAGIGLFQGSDYVGAARAFQRSTELNPESRDATFNLAQAAYLAATEAEEGSDVPEQMWPILVDAGRRLVELDPANENAFRLYAQGLIRTGDEQEAVRLLEMMEALTFEVLNTQLQPVAGGGAILTGEVLNRSRAAGSSVRLSFSFSSDTGQVLGTSDVQVQLGGEGESVPFEVEFDSASEVNGFRYSVLN
jgi:tetratricopeptide (TPR) repeat protein